MAGWTEGEQQRRNPDKPSWSKTAGLTTLPCSCPCAAYLGSCSSRSLHAETWLVFVCVCTCVREGARGGWLERERKEEGMKNELSMWGRADGGWRRRRREVADDCSKGIPRLEKGFAPFHPPTLSLLLTPHPEVLGFISVHICFNLTEICSRVFPHRLKAKPWRLHFKRRRASSVIRTGSTRPMNRSFQRRWK